MDGIEGRLVKVETENANTIPTMRRLEDEQRKSIGIFADLTKDVKAALDYRDKDIIDKAALMERQKTLGTDFSNFATSLRTSLRWTWSIAAVLAFLITTAIALLAVYKGVR